MNSLQVSLEHSAMPSVFELVDQHQLDSVHIQSDPASQLHAIIAIHSTRLGPALGGCRCIAYDCESDAFVDAARLARGMSYKAALSGVPHGGGKAVILQPKGSFERATLYRAFGRFVETLGGRYITAIDSGTSLSDMDMVAQETSHLAGSHKDGLDPSPVTALGVYAGIKAAVANKYRLDSLQDLSVAIQGLGNVGYALAGLLYEAGAKLIVSDIDPLKVARCESEFGARPCDPDVIYQTECDIFAPCGLGGIINDYSFEKLKCGIVAGSANNQLAERYHGQLLYERDILYAPDYVINAGGLIQVSFGSRGRAEGHVREKTLAIGQTLSRIFERSKADNAPPSHIADLMAEEILQTTE